MGRDRWATLRMWLDYARCRLTGHSWGFEPPLPAWPYNPDQCSRCGDLRWVRS